MATKTEAELREVHALHEWLLTKIEARKFDPDGLSAAIFQNCLIEWILGMGTSGADACEKSFAEYREIKRRLTRHETN